MLKAKSTPYMPTYYHQRTHHKQRKPHAISGGGGPDLSASGSPFFFLSSLPFFPFSIGGTKARAITSQHGKQKNTHKFTGKSLYRGKVIFFFGNADAPRNPRTEFGPRWETEEGGAEARSELCGASGVLGRRGLVGSWRGEERGREFHEILFSPLLFLSRLLFPA